VALASLGGTLQSAQQDAFFAPFTKATQIDVKQASWDGTLATLQARARMEAGDVWDLVLMDHGAVQLACDQGLLQPIDAASVPGLADVRPDLTPDAISRCGLGALRINLVLAWDRSRIDSPPSWSDFWDVAKRPGKRGLRRDPRSTLEIALLADGVAPEDVYRTLGSQEGLDRAFRKLDQLKPYIVWWDSPEQAIQIIESGAVLMTSAPNGEIAAADQQGHRDFGIQWQQSLSMQLDWAMPGRPLPIGAPAPAPDSPDTTRRTHVRALLGFMLDRRRQEDFVSAYRAASVMQDVPQPGQAVAEDNPANSAHRDQALPVDDAFWRTHEADIRARFNAWIGN